MTAGLAAIAARFRQGSLAESIQVNTLAVELLTAEMAALGQSIAAGHPGRQ